MAEEKKKLFGFGSKPKEDSNTGAAHTTAAAAANALHQVQTGQAAALGTKPTANTGRVTATASANTTAAKPNAVKPTAAATTGEKPTAAAAASAKPTATAAAPAVKPTAVKPTTVVQTKFTDVPAGAYYAEAVDWAVKKGITSGVTDTTFNPTGACHRGHVATFIWRYKGSRVPKAATSPYSDVTDGPFFKAILWAVENNIMEPVSADKFNPQEPCTRAQVLMYLLRASGKPGATAADATAWATQKNLLAGQTGGTAAPCTRADFVTYLYRSQK